MSEKEWSVIDQGEQPKRYMAAKNPPEGAEVVARTAKGPMAAAIANGLNALERKEGQLGRTCLGCEYLDFEPAGFELSVGGDSVELTPACLKCGLKRWSLLGVTVDDMRDSMEAAETCSEFKSAE